MNKPDIFSASGFSREEFLRDYWQKKPLVLRRAVRQSDLAFLPGKNTLLKLAEHEDVQSRAVVTENTPNADPHYHVEYGPFTTDDWANLGDEPWTILVSDVEKWLPGHRRLLDYFPFIRRWLFDDLMFSYATRGASVGAHTDHYDVFLVQVAGSRQWSYGQQPLHQAEYRTGTELKLLRHFEPDHRVVLNPGDLLYLPAEVAHHGIALDDDCITCSVGLRAPAEGELLSGYFEDRAAALDASRRFSPAFSDSQAAPAQITTEDVAQLRALLEKHLSLDDDQLGQWFGRFITGYRNLFFELDAPADNAADSSEPITQQWLPDPFARWAWRALPGKSEQTAEAAMAELFVNGQSHLCSQALARALCDDRCLTTEKLARLSATDQAVVRQLADNGEIHPK